MFTLNGSLFSFELIPPFYFHTTLPVLRPTVRATTRSGYVISCNLIGSELNQNIELTAKGLSSTEMSNRETLKQIAVVSFGWNVPYEYREVNDRERFL